MGGRSLFWRKRDRAETPAQVKTPEWHTIARPNKLVAGKSQKAPPFKKAPTTGHDWHEHFG
jgi:hypothetical protein